MMVVVRLTPRLPKTCVRLHLTTTGSHGLLRSDPSMFHLFQVMLNPYRPRSRGIVRCRYHGGYFMMPTTRAASKTTQIAAAVIGNAFEWYDFIAFGFLTLVIARLFFPTDSQYTSLLLTT